MRARGLARGVSRRAGFGRVPQTIAYPAGTLGRLFTVEQSPRASGGRFALPLGIAETSG
jgi:hypothetical protein